MWRPSLARAALALVVATIAGCAVRPSTIEEEAPLIMLKSVRLPVRDWLPWYSRFAEHTWIDYYHNSSWHRVEWDDVEHIVAYDLPPGEAFDDVRWEREVAVHNSFHGEWAKEAAAKVLSTAQSYEYATQYTPWPGPNSNSFIDWLARQIGLSIVMPPSAVGKDYTPWVHAGITSSRSGVELETMLLGAQIGLCEGVEAHVLGLTLGVGLWPPAIKLPFLPAVPGGWFAN